MSVSNNISAVLGGTVGNRYLKRLRLLAAALTLLFAATIASIGSYLSTSSGAIGEIPVVEPGFTSNTALGSSSLSLDKPAGVETGDLLLIIVGNDSGSNRDQWDNGSRKPAGFTLINESGNRTNDCHVGAFYRVADGSEGANITVPARHTRDYWGYYIRVTGADTANPINVNGGDTNTAASVSSIAIPGISTSTDNALAFYNHCFDGADSGGFSVSGAGWTESSEIHAGTLGRHASGSWGTKEQATAGDTGTATATSAVRNDGFSGFQFAVAPEPAPPTNQPPTADAGPDLATELGQQTDFDGSGSSDPDGSIVSYDWDFGDGNSGNGVTTNHTYAVEGVYTATLTVTDDAGATDVDTTEVTISQAPPAIPDAPVLHDNDGTTQLAFNDARMNSSAPTFRASATHSGSFDTFQLELNAAADFTGAAYTQTFNGTYDSATAYNLEANGLSPSLPTADGATYFARARASADSGATWSDWSSESWAYTYKSSGDPDWYQATDEQFNSGTFVDTATTGSDTVGLTTAPSGGAEYSDNFDRADSATVGAPWEELLGDWEISGQAVGTTSADASALRYGQDLGSADHWAQATLGSYSGGEIGLVLRFAGVGTGYVVQISGNVPTLLIANGGDISLHSSTGPAHTPTPGDVYRAEIQGSQIRLYINGSLHHTWTDSTITGHPRTGLFTNLTSAATWDDFSTGTFGSGSASGSIMSSPVDVSDVIGATGWSEFGWTEDETNGSISAQLYHSVGSTCDTVVPNSALAGNEAGFASGPVNIQSLNTATYNELCIKATLTNTGSGTPYLEAWHVGWDFGAPPQNQSPAANAGPDQGVTLGNSVSFDGSDSTDPDGTITDYSWNFGDGNTASGVSPNHTYGAVGVYTVTLTVTDNAGATGVDTAEVTVSDVPSNTDAATYIDVSYGPHGRNYLDLFVPEGPGPFPVIMWHHGGYWVSGDKDHNPFASYTNNGYAVASVNYRYANGSSATYPQLLDDVEAALNMVVSGAIDPRIDPNRAIMSGYSAGAHLSALLTLTRDVPVSGVLTFGGPMELMFTQRALESAYAIGYTDAELNSILQPILGCTLPDGCTAGQDVGASPTQQVNGPAPPFYIVQGLSDDINPPEQAEFMAEALAAGGVTHTLELVPGLDHDVSLTSGVNQFLVDIFGF